MKEEEIKELFEQFEAIANEYEGVECWSARELAQVLGYSKWERFEGVIERAKDACINAVILQEEMNEFRLFIRVEPIEKLV